MVPAKILEKNRRWEARLINLKRTVQVSFCILALKKAVVVLRELLGLVESWHRLMLRQQLGLDGSCVGFW